MNKAYFGKDRATGRWYAMTEIPRITQWGQTAEEAQAKLNEYLLKHYRLTVINWRLYQPEKEG